MRSPEGASPWPDRGSANSDFPTHPIASRPRTSSSLNIGPSSLYPTMFSAGPPAPSPMPLPTAHVPASLMPGGRLRGRSLGTDTQGLFFQPAPSGASRDHAFQLSQDMPPPMTSAHSFPPPDPHPYGPPPVIHKHLFRAQSSPYPLTSSQADAPPPVPPLPPTPAPPALPPSPPPLPPPPRFSPSSPPLPPYATSAPESYFHLPTSHTAFPPSPPAPPTSYSNPSPEVSPSPTSTPAPTFSSIQEEEENDDELKLALELSAQSQEQQERLASQEEEELARALAESASMTPRHQPPFHSYDSPGASSSRIRSSAESGYFQTPSVATPPLKQSTSQSFVTTTSTLRRDDQIQSDEALARQLAAEEEKLAAQQKSPSTQTHGSPAFGLPDLPPYDSAPSVQPISQIPESSSLSPNVYASDVNPVTESPRSFPAQVDPLEVRSSHSEAHSEGATNATSHYDTISPAASTSQPSALGLGLSSPDERSSISPGPESMSTFPNQYVDAELLMGVCEHTCFCPVTSLTSSQLWDLLLSQFPRR
ncbi:hypothetical protein JAAARDRAFT_52579 [Jaapia argillacea MUCL 33604]|uniref:Uncharacterized protein n=1 Tax=Jaapia argillacea MUCL 33604 TaxID=933084 RepID=A0A067QC37_9AGAM|nr:hypothetical protein JAAARDRAFT_52579 [Jaapia argillacea MUCL 33604]